MTIELHVEIFPCTSVTVRRTVFVPRFVQSKFVLLTESDAIPQLSKLPLSISPGVMILVPVARSSVILMFLQIAVGFSLSVTVTVWSQLLTLPWISVTTQ